MDFILLVFICMLFTKIYYLLKKEKKPKTHHVILFSRQHKAHKGQEVLSVSVWQTSPPTWLPPERNSKESHSCSGLLLIASTTESEAFPAEGKVYERKLLVET